MVRGTKIINFISYRMRVTLLDGRVIVGQFLAFDKHMNLVLGDCEEFRQIKAKSKAKGSEAEIEEKRCVISFFFSCFLSAFLVSVLTFCAIQHARPRDPPR